MPLRRPVGVVALLATVLSSLALLPASAAHAQAGDPSVFLNEIHYDNASTDVGEFVEVAGPVGADLSGWSVVLYNGNNGASYATLPLTGTLADSSDGYGFVAVAEPGIQNGAPDGLALVDAAGQVVQFLSYEGVMTASSGPAAGLTSTDIGVEESSTTPAGQSLQLSGTGDSYADFTWQPAADATPGAVNTGQVFQAPDGPAAPTASCQPTLVVDEGKGGSAALSATDADSRVTTAEITSTPVAGTALTDVQGATATAGTATATLLVDESALPGTHDVVVEFGTDDQPPQTTTCTVRVTVVPLLSIAEVQGDGAVSDYTGDRVRIEGVVVGDFQERGQFGGFYVQSLSPDDDPLTSEGIRVYENTAAVSVGDHVSVQGVVSEFASSGALYSGSETQLGSASVTVLGPVSVPAPTPVELPFAPTVDGVDGQERYEGMLATVVNDDLVATDLYTLGRFGEVSLTTGELLYIPTSVEENAANDRDRITLDDGLSGQNLTTLPYTIDGDGQTLPRAGDAPVDPVTGVLTYSFGEWRIEPPVGTTIDFAARSEREPAPQDVGGDVKVASFNVLNYFVDFGGANRGAGGPEELQRQQDKLVAAITGLDADVVGLIEIANDDGEALATLVDAVNAAQDDAADHYTAVIAPPLNGPTSLGGTYGTDAIRQAIIYRAATVTPAGPPPSDPEVLNPADPQFPDEPLFDRPPAVQTFTPVDGDRDVTVVVNHFKSKGSNNEQCGTPDAFGGNCDDLRERQAAGVVDLVEELGVEDALLVGDFNAYEQEAPIQVLEDAGYVSSVADQPREDRFSYSFDGEFGSLDYVFLSPSLVPALTGADIWQINSREAVALDYNDYNQPALYAPGPFASSDHDPVLVGLDLVPAPTTPPTQEPTTPPCQEPTTPPTQEPTTPPSQEPTTPPADGVPARTAQPTANGRPIDDSCPVAEVPARTFSDVPAGDVHALAIRCLAWFDVAQGYTDGSYGPLDGVTRGQMAAFIARTVQETTATLPADPADRFADDDGTTHELAINQLAAVGIVTGRTDGTYGADDTVSRAQMTSFLVRAYEHVSGVELPLPATATQYFDDVAGLTQADDVNRAAAVGLAEGRAGRAFAPHDPTLRGQMGTFLARLLDLFVEDGKITRPAS